MLSHTQPESEPEPEIFLLGPCHRVLPGALSLSPALGACPSLSFLSHQGPPAPSSGHFLSLPGSPDCPRETGCLFSVL